MGITETGRSAERSRGRRVLGWAILALVLLVAALWLLWGFRWPPTAEVVDDPPEVSRPGPGPAGTPRAGDPGVGVG